MRAARMRAALLTFLAVGFATSLAVGASAFNWGSVSRAVGVTIVTDSAAYVGIDAYASSSHRCFVDTTNGKISITFDTPSAGCGSGAGTGVNAGDGSATAKYSRYAFHDILAIVNKDSGSRFLWVNATTSSGSSSAVEIAIKTTAGTMTDSDYSGAVSLTSASFPLAGTAYLGVRVKSGTLTSGSVTGTITVEARS